MDSGLLLAEHYRTVTPTVTKSPDPLGGAPLDPIPPRPLATPLDGRFRLLTAGTWRRITEGIRARMGVATPPRA